MRIAVDFPAPFSPTMAWMVPGSTRMSMWSLASTSPKRLVMALSSSMNGCCPLLRHGVGDLNLPGDDSPPGLFRLTYRLRADERAVEVVHRVGDAVRVQPVDVEAALELSFHHVGDDLVDGVVHALDHAGEDEAGLDHVLVRVHADDEAVGTPLRVFAGLLDRVEGAEARVAGGGEDDVGALAYLRQRQLLALARVVPRAVGDADVVDDDARVGAGGLRALLVALGEAVDEPDVHPADEAEHARLRLFRGDHPDEVRAFVLLEDERGHVRQLARAVHDGEVDVGVVLRD